MPSGHPAGDPVNLKRVGVAGSAGVAKTAKKFTIVLHG